MKPTKRKLKPTPWFDAHEHLPLRSRPGYYQCKCCAVMFWWNGQYFTSPKTDRWIWVDYWRGVQR